MRGTSRQLGVVVADLCGGGALVGVGGLGAVNGPVGEAVVVVVRV